MTNVSSYLLPSFYNKNKTLLFVFLVLTFGLLVLIGQEFLIMKDHYYEYYGSQMSIDRIDSMLDFQSKWKWLTYVFIPVIFLFKFTLITTWLLTGTIFWGYNTSFKSLFQIVLVSEFVFFIPSLTKIIWFGIIHTEYTLEELSYFVPLSLINLFNTRTLDPWWIYPLQSINIFEIVYILVLAFGISRIIKRSYQESLKLTFPVYFSGLLIWIIFITFLTLNFS